MYDAEDLQIMPATAGGGGGGCLLYLHRR